MPAPQLNRAYQQNSSYKTRPVSKPQPAQMELTAGADPEMFAIDENGIIRSVIGLIGGSKHAPKSVEGAPGFFLQEDNVALEFNVPIATRKSEFVHNITHGVDLCKKALAAVNLHAHIAGSVKMPESELLHPAAREFGCNEFLSAWSFEAPERLSNEMLQNPNDRFAAGHVHLGIPKIDGEPFRRMHWARTLDYILAAPALSWMSDRELEEERVRRTMYGKAGSYRPKPYGIEYIVLSNFWIKREETIGAVWDAISFAYKNFNPDLFGKKLNTEWGNTSAVLRGAINTCNKQVAAECVAIVLGADIADHLISLSVEQYM